MIMNNLNEDFFSDYIDEFNFIKNHYESYGTIPDFATFLAKFESFDNISVNEPPKYLLDALYEDRNKRAIAKAFNRIRKLWNDDKIEESMTEFTKACESFSDAKHLDSVDIFKDTSRFDIYENKLNNLDKYYVTTGLQELDRVLGGGWDRYEELATIVARTNMGKSWILLKCAVAAAMTGLKVGLYSGEMSETKVGYRIDTIISNISNSAIQHGNESIHNDYKEYINELKSGKFRGKELKGTIKVLTPAMICGTAGVNALRAFIEKEKLDMLCVDQHSLLEDDNKAKNPVERASNISRDLKKLQVLSRIPIITVSQQNRSSTENGVDTTMIAQTDRIGQDSTVVVFFEQKDGIMKLYLTKARDVANGKELEYAINFDSGEFVFQGFAGDGVTTREELNKDSMEYDGVPLDGDDMEF